ncbi:hypothetical protein EV199_0379 [Pseudobacter ginsenosidimutans]|jgi:hypothetical protein|uniref:Uncharacterized protein n=1 Tax=Pseudobacter ginsenosidimutans TaxID=661488 RepID=A0A4Q7MZ44_9BACT|nr:hypothetical protein EV199_0379 [Pseudobacter ginsenosidimutans]
MQCNKNLAAVNIIAAPSGLSSGHTYNHKIRPGDYPVRNFNFTATFF